MGKTKIGKSTLINKIYEKNDIGFQHSDFPDKVGTIGICVNKEPIDEKSQKLILLDSEGIGCGLG